MDEDGSQLFFFLKLTNQTDILPAISGCARAIARWTGEEYIAGMWKERLHDNLLWMNGGPNKQRTKPARHTKWTAPTWSWASLPCGQRINFFALRENGKNSRRRNFLHRSIIEVVCERDGPDAFGRIKSGHLEIEAELLPCKLRRYCVMIFNGVHTEATNRRFDDFDLHCPKGTDELRCQTPDVGLDVYEAGVEVWLYYNLSNDLSFDQLSSCSLKCGLAAIYIFLIHQERYYQGQCVDHFMILKGNNPEDRVYDRMVRIGILVLIDLNQSQRDRWFEEVWSANVLLFKHIIIQ